MSKPGMEKVSVIGAGFMGSGIAQVSAMAGLEVYIYDSKPEAVAKALEGIKWSLAKLKSKGRLRDDPEMVLKRISKIDQLDAAASSDLVIEAVYESVPLKQELFEKLGKIVKPGAIIGTNTSSIPIHLLSSKAPGPERVIGTHFFGPVPLMGLVELVMGPETTEGTLETAKGYVRRIGKTPIVVRKPSPGFLVNRIFFATAMEALRCYSEGIGTPEDIDTGMKLGYGWAAGPFEIMDNAGLDIMAGVFGVLGGEPPAQIQELLKQGRLGRKVGKGFYHYGPDGKKV